MGDLSLHFDRKEFACKCGCGFDDIDYMLVVKLQTIRQNTGIQMKINSGCRCEAYNAEIGGVPDSAHTKGRAADIAIPNNETRYHLLRMIFTEFYRIGIYNSFIHVDIDDQDKPSFVAWHGK